MTTAGICTLILLLGQTWGQPVVQEAELAAPVVIEQSPSPDNAKKPLSPGPVSSQDLESHPDMTKKGAAAQPAQEIHWEYDDDAKPVARPASPATDTSSTAKTPNPSAKSAVPVKKEESATQPRDSRPVATFWFVLPK